MSPIGRRRFLRDAAATAALLPLGGCCFGGTDRSLVAPAVTPPAAPPTTTAPVEGSPIVWDPARTVVFAVGLLRWHRSDVYASFPRAERRDQALVDTLARRGVPRERITYLHDREATLAATRAGLHAAIDSAHPDDTFLFYWTGHGDRTDAGDSYAVPFDAGDDSSTSCLAYDEIVRAVEGGRMRRALLFADTCYSGAIADAVMARSGGPPRAGFGSSSASETSTGAWTFTDAVIAAFGGSAGTWGRAWTRGTTSQNMGYDNSRGETGASSFLRPPSYARRSYAPRWTLIQCVIPNGLEAPGPLAVLINPRCT